MLRAVVVAIVLAGASTGHADWRDGETWFGRLPRDVDDLSYGSVATGVGDTDGDGRDELLIAAPALGWVGLVSQSTGDVVWSRRAGHESGFGRVLARLGDVDGDGRYDFAIGAPNHDQVWVYAGGASGVATRAPWRFGGDDQDGPSGFGSAISASDIDGDGYGDLIIGAHGEVQIHMGSSAGPEARVAWRERGEPELGTLVMNAFDVDGDGRGDVLIGSARHVTLYGGPGFEPLTSWDIAGPEAIAAIGDRDGDGFSDLALRDAQGLHLIYGGDFTRQDLGIEATGRVSAAGDVDGDGLMDVVIGDAAGVVIVLGGSRGEAPQRRVALHDYQALTTGDVDGDGLSDVIAAGARFVVGESGPNAVEVVPGGGAGPGTHGDVAFTLARAAAPVHVASAGDTDGDGRDELLVGAERWSDRGASDEGRVWLIERDADRAWRERWSSGGRTRGERLGVVAGAGDVDGDGYDDVLVAAPRADYGGVVQAGRVALWLGGRDGPGSDARFEVPGTALDAAFVAALMVAERRFGSAIGSAGDIDGDGRGDLVLGTRDGPLAALLVPRGDLAEATLLTRAEGDAALHGPVIGVGDLDGDGFDDLAHAATPGFGTTPGLVVFRGPDHTRVTFHGSESIGDGVAALGDIDGDGRSDVFVRGACAGGGGASWRPGDARDGLGSARNIGGAAGLCLVTQAGAGDVDGDGRGDVVVASSSQGHWFRGTPYGMAMGWSYSFGDVAEPSCAAGDFDGDGRDDLVLVAERDGALDVLVFDGNGEFDRGSAFPLTARALQPDDDTPIGVGGITRRRDGFDVIAVARSPFGGSTWIEVQAVPFLRAFEGGTTWRSEVGTGELRVKVRELEPGTRYRWRARVRYDGAVGAPIGGGRWVEGRRGARPAHVRTATNEAPVAREDGPYRVTQGTPRFVAAGVGPLANDEDPEGDRLEVALASDGTHGRVQIEADGTFAYTPRDPGYWGLDEFRYVVRDSFGAEAESTVRLIVERSGACGAARCETGDAFVSVRLRDGSVASVRCVVEDGTPRCDTDAEGRLVLREPVCQ